MSCALKIFDALPGWHKRGDGKLSGLRVGLFSARSPFSVRRLGFCALFLILAAQAAWSQTPQPVLLSETNSTRAIALESVTRTREPFALNSLVSWSADRRTRIMLFAMNLSLQPNETLAAVTAWAEDAAGRRYVLRVEQVGAVPGKEWMSSVIVRLSDQLTEVGDVLVWVAYRGVASNRVRLGIGHVGGGLPDDQGAVPTPPLLVRGRVLLNGLGLGDASLLVGGSQTATLTTAADGSYSFIAAPLGNLTLTPQAQFFDFDPPSRLFTRLENNLLASDFTARRQLRNISGLVTDEAGHPVEGVSVKLRDAAGTTLRVLKSQGSGFTFTGVPAGFAYTIEAVSTPVFSFKAISTGTLVADTKLTFTGQRLSYNLGGHVADGRGGGVGGTVVSLSKSGRRTTTDAKGFYKFSDVPAGFAYSVAVTKPYVEFDPASRNLGSLESDRADVDFDATQETYNIHGLIHDNVREGVLNFTVRLTAGADFEPRIAITDDTGQFSFLDVPAGASYTIAPLKDTIATFAPLALAPLNQTVLLDIKATRRLYSISGHIAGEVGPVAGVTVEMLEYPRMRTTTDASGNYSFKNLVAGRTFTLRPSIKDYKFLPESPTIFNLDANKQVDFEAVLNFILAGRVTDANGKGIFGITVALSGAGSADTFTDGDGNFSFLVNHAGNYTLAPAVEQGYYTFTPPSFSFVGAQSSQTAPNFNAVLTQTYSPSHVLEFDGTPMSVDHDVFWDPGKNLGHFFWEVWAMPSDKTNDGYMIADGYGGAHAILFGFSYLNGSEPNHYQLAGNVWNTQQLVRFASDEGPQPFEWGHFAVGWDGQYIVTYFDGVPVGRLLFNGLRRTVGITSGGSMLLVGGSDHSNFAGRMAQIRGYEGTNPREGDGSDKSLPFTTFTPQTVFSPEGNLASYFFRPGDPISDLSGGQDGKPHPGVRRGTKYGVLAPCDGCPIPEFVIDPTAPDFSNPDNPGQPNAPTPFTPPPAPANALVFDSFTRANSTYILGGKGGLGSTEGGTLAPLAWQTNVDASQSQPFGILNGRAVLLANSRSVAWVETGAPSANLEVRINRRPRSFGTGQNTGVSFRVLDASNFFFAYTSEGNKQADPKKLTLGYYLDGVRTDLVTDFVMPKNSWATLTVRTYADGRIQVVVNAKVIYSTTSNVLSNSTGIGLYNNASGLGLTNRWDDFTVFALQ